MSIFVPKALHAPDKHHSKMKAKSIIGLFFCLLSVTVTTSSCEDMLTPDMDNYMDANKSLKDSVYSYFGIINSLQGVIEQNIILGDVRSDLMGTTAYTSDSLAKLANFERVSDGDNSLVSRAAYYNVINHCNFYMANADTVSTKNYNFYMRKEFAQVAFIRAWAYMQLVQNYGRVPFIVKPVDKADTGWETNPEDWATPDNLLDLLLAKGNIERAYEFEKQYGFPRYGAISPAGSTGGVSISTQKMLFPGDIVMGELYLMRGASKADFEMAASYYHEYFTDEHDAFSNRRANSATYVKLEFGDRVSYIVSPQNWMNLFANNYGDKEIVTLIPSAANSSFGKVLTRVPQFYGFVPHSEISTGQTVNSSGETETNTVGAISISPNLRARQIAPSASYEALSKAQAYCLQSKETDEPDEVLPDVGDARFAGVAPYVVTEDSRDRFIQKYGLGRNFNGFLGEASNFNFRYALVVYRMHQIMLHYAEAINRAGYPNLAFAILRDGFCSEVIPSVRVDTIVDSVNYVKTATLVLDSIEDGANFIRPYELIAALGYQGPDTTIAAVPYLNLYDLNVNFLNYGIHEHGGGVSSDDNFAYNYATTVGQRIIDEAIRTGGNVEQARRYAARMMDDESTSTPSYTIVNLTLPEQMDEEELQAHQNAVETLIADELALETSFEGTRFYDLTRMARHKNVVQPDYGTRWFAWLVARRALGLAPYEDATNVGDATLYGRLISMDNWYLQNPVY